MSMDELIDRLRYRFNDYWHSEKRSVKVIARLLAFTLFAAVISTIAPTLADELSTDPQMLEPVVQVQESSTVTILPETVTSTASPSASPTPEAVISRPPIPQSSESPTILSTESATADGPGVPLEIQPKYVVKIPPTGAIDPRATTYFLPHIYLTTSAPSPEYSMVCISGTSGMRFDALQKGVVNALDQGNELISGDLTGVLLISAETSRLVTLINSYNGLFTTTWSGGLAGRSLSLRFIAVTKPVVDGAYCEAAKSAAAMTLRPLGLDLSTIKGGGKLK